MSKQIINVGQSANDRSGDPLRNAFEKVNSNFTELYSAIVDGVSLDQVNSDWNAVSGVARILNKPTIPTNTNQLTNGAGFITDTDRIVNGAKEIVLDANGSLTVPYPSQESFRIRLDSANFVPRPGKATLTLTGDAWDFYGAFANSQDGQRELVVDSGPLPSIVNPGYEDGDTFEIDSTAHGVVGFILTVILNNVVQAGPDGWTANLAFSPPPDYPSTVKSLGAVKLTANTNSLILGTDGTVTVSGAIKQGITKLNLNEGGGGNVYLTTTTDDTTAVFMTSTGIQTFARESVNLYAGTTLAATETTYNDQLVMLNDFWAQVSGEVGYPWGITLPLSANTYDEIIQLAPGTISNQTILTVTANSVSNAWTEWQNALDNTSVSIGVSSGSWAFKPNGSFAINNNEVHIGTNNWGQIAFANANTVIYTQKSNTNLASIRVHATIEGDEDGDTTGRHTQACDMMIVRRVSNPGVSTVDSVVYGVIYTGAGPLATLDAQWNAVTNKIEITATPVSTTTNVFVKIYATEVARGD